MHGVLGIGHENVCLAVRVAFDRALRHENGLGIDALVDMDPDVHAGQQQAVGVGEPAAKRTCPVSRSTVTSENRSWPVRWSPLPSTVMEIGRLLASAC
ncbi:hypothetical protein VM57_04165 [Stenotrophomonas maltophilia]|uniref:Uncharacterized protein n=1 Tax=Stenotrophomonas maltophilia TaxID=40324 RepID=A0A0F5ZPL7_STEMA|nr:hypothetical protein VM57_04165 [Stenotrophomonas maltophilia]